MITISDLISEFQRQESYLRADQPRVRRLRQLLNGDLADWLGWKQPTITNVGYYLPDCSRFDGFIKCISTPSPDGLWGTLKEPIIAGLIANQYLMKGLNKKTKNIVDGGGISTGYCLKEVCKKIDVEISFITSRFFPERILSEFRSDRMSIIKAPPSDRSIEHEFYEYIIKFIQEKNKRKRDYTALWHVKWSNLIARIYADCIIRNFINEIMELDVIVVGVGSGATLAIASRLKEANPSLKIVVAEHESTALFSQLKGGIKQIKNINNNDYSGLFWDYTGGRIPNMVLGPHFESINNKMPSAIIAGIDGVMTYSNADWQTVSAELLFSGAPVGNSSAANIAVANYIGKSSNLRVLTFVYEPLREFMLSDSTQVSRGEAENGLRNVG